MANKKVKEIKVMNIANDLGYGSIKATVDGKGVFFPSVMSKVGIDDRPKGVTFSNSEDKDEYMKNIMDNLYISINSQSVREEGRMFVGNRAIREGLSAITFDVNDMGSKSDDDLAMFMTLGVIAGKRVQDAYFSDKEDITDILDVDVNMTTALPIIEGSREGATEHYEERFTQCDHIVTIHNFLNPIVVKIHFNKVIVASEGEVAQFAIMNSDTKMLKRLKKDFDKHYKKLFEEDVPAEQLIDPELRTLGIDIGEGTTDIVTIADDTMVLSASTSLEKGYGNVKELAVDTLQTKGLPIKTREQLDQYLNQSVTFANKRSISLAREVLHSKHEDFANEIVSSVSKALNRASGISIDVVYVYGGGAIPMREVGGLREKLSEKLAKFNAGNEIPVIWIDDTVSQKLNMMGLQLILESI